MSKFDSTGAQMMADRNTAPFTDYVPITPSDDELEDGPCRGIMVNADGLLNLTTIAGDLREDVTVLKGINHLSAAIIDEPTTGSPPTAVVALY